MEYFACKLVEEETGITRNKNYREGLWPWKKDANGAWVQGLLRGYGAGFKLRSFCPHALRIDVGKALCMSHKEPIAEPLPWRPIS